MPQKIDLPECMLQAVQCLLPAIVYSRVTYYVGFETGVDHGQAATTMQEGSSQKNLLQPETGPDRQLWFSRLRDTVPHRGPRARSRPASIPIQAEETLDQRWCSNPVRRFRRPPFCLAGQVKTDSAESAVCCLGMRG